LGDIVEIVEINEANWSEVLDEYDPTEELTASVRTVITEDERRELSHLRETLPWERRRP